MKCGVSWEYAIRRMNNELQTLMWQHIRVCRNEISLPQCHSELCEDELLRILPEKSGNVHFMYSDPSICPEWHDILIADSHSDTALCQFKRRLNTHLKHCSKLPIECSIIIAFVLCKEDTLQSSPFFVSLPPNCIIIYKWVPTSQKTRNRGSYTTHSRHTYDFCTTWYSIARLTCWTAKQCPKTARPPSS